MASDDVETSAYQIKDALDANFTYVPAPEHKESSSSSQGDDSDVDEPDIGTGGLFLIVNYSLLYIPAGEMLVQYTLQYLVSIFNSYQYSPENVKLGVTLKKKLLIL